MVKTNYDVAIEEREQWKDAAHQVDLLIEALASNAQVIELRDHMRRAAADWEDCSHAFAEFLDSLTTFN